MAVIDLKAVREEAERVRRELEGKADRQDLWIKYAVDGVNQPFGFPPALAFADATVAEQLNAVVAEAKELVEAMAHDDERSGEWLIEAMDVHHALETLWRILTLRYGPEVVNNVRTMVIQKNAERGYYLARTSDPEPEDA